ncbi:MAG: peptidoglycan DD-metalloendopeptidase family protein [Gammaproteobacteria bacterium]|nr:peptidoglycan DD-metalloendopeptidase family protein [Gammaproteobacteria bacterium]
MKNDYKGVVGSSLTFSPPKRKRRRLPILVALTAGVCVALAVSNTIANSKGQPPTESTQIALPESANNSFSLELPLPAAETVEGAIQLEQVEEPASPAMPIIEASLTVTHATVVKPGQPITDTDPVSPVEETITAPDERTEPTALLPAKQSQPESPIKEASVEKGDTLSEIFHRVGIKQRQLYQLLADKALKKRLKRLKPGQKLVFHMDKEERLQTLEWRMNETETLQITRDGDGFSSILVTAKFERRLATATGAIDSSLFIAGQKAGLSDNLIMRMVGILGWDIDFALDIRADDRFTVIYEELFNEDGKKVRNGRIQAVEFINQGETVVALRYTDPTGFTDYYSPDGHSMRKAFLRTPVNFSRISSRFTRARRHPILNRNRAHKGVDYAAPTGTPIKAAGVGKVILKARKGGYGRTVILRHGGKYSTLYGHLSRYAKGIKKGSKVRQGQVIGYVGKSGLATGPHLHYEFRINGVHRNPLKVKLPKALPLKKGYHQDFKITTRPYLAQLDLLRHTQVALNNN